MKSHLLTTLVSSYHLLLINGFSTAGRQTKPYPSKPFGILATAKTSARLSMSVADDDANLHPLSTTSRISHAMFRVPDVSETVEYWKNKGATLSSLRTNTKPDGSIRETAFVTLGNGQKDAEGEATSCFSLELVTLDPTSEFEMGNAFHSLGLSMLLGFQNNLEAAAAGRTPDRDTSQMKEPNGMEVKSVAAAPGDYFSRIHLNTSSREMESTRKFYDSYFGIETVAVDDDMLCMRYKSKEGAYGVPITLVFGTTDEEIVIGNCFDHIVIDTENSIDAEWDRIRDLDRDNEKSVVFMKPTEMFGVKLIGLTDPNGYQIYLCGAAGQETN